MILTTIVVTKNDDLRLLKTLKSIAAQFGYGTEWEVLVFDGASDNRTESLVQKFVSNGPRVSYCNGNDSGIYDAMNQAIELASGKYVHFLNCGDTFSAPNSLAAILGLTTSKMDFYTWNLWDEEKSELISLESLSLSNLILGKTSYCHQGQLLSKHLLERIGPLNTELNISADFELTLRATTLVTVVNCAEVLVNYEGNGVSRKYPKLLYLQKQRAFRNWITWITFTKVRIEPSLLARGKLINSSRLAFRIYRKLRALYD